MNDSLKPAFEKRNIPVVFSSDNNYAPYLYVCLKSLLAHVKSCDKYKAYILYTELSECHQKNLLNLQTDNLKIEFINVETIISKYKDNFLINNHFTIETYYRFFLPRIFPKLDKVLYLDADTLILHDIAPLFSIDIGDNYLGVTHDCEIVRMSNLDDTEYSDYFIKTLCVKIENYFQAGVMLVNLEKMRQDNIIEKLLSALIKIGTPKFVDQDILNKVCQRKVKFISQIWNYTWHLRFIDDDYLDHIGSPLSEEYKNAQLNPAIIHFTGNKMKPTDFPNTKEAKEFAEFVKNSPYFEFFENKRHVSEQINLKKIKKIKRKIFKYKMLNLLTIGMFYHKYSQKITRKELELNRFTKYVKGNI